MKRIHIVIFIVIAALDLYMVVNNLPRYWTKPLLMLSLILWSTIQLKGKVRDHKVFLVAQCFAFLGDVFLLGDGNTFFILGLGSFLVMQFLYAYVFYRQKGIGFHKHRLPVGLIMVVGFLFLAMLLPHTGQLKIPVIVYNLSIMGMVIFAILRWKVKGYYLVVIGAVLFLISDATLGYAKFVDQVSYSGFIVMLTYSAAQLCIVNGYLKALVN